MERKTVTGLGPWVFRGLVVTAALFGVAATVGIREVLAEHHDCDGDEPDHMMLRNDRMFPIVISSITDNGRELLDGPVVVQPETCTNVPWVSGPSHLAVTWKPAEGETAHYSVKYVHYPGFLTLAIDEGLEWSGPTVCNGCNTAAALPRDSSARFQ